MMTPFPLFTVIFLLEIALILENVDVARGTHAHSQREMYVRISTVLVEPYVMKLETRSDDYDGQDLEYNGYDVDSNEPVVYVGYMVDLLDKVTEILGLKYRLFPVKGDQYGFLQQDGTWNGMIGELLRREMDIAAAPLFVTEQRSAVVDFSRPFLSVRATVLMRRPPLGHGLRIKSPVELTQQRQIKYGTKRGGMVWRALRKSNDTRYNDIWRNMKSFDSSVFTYNNEDGIQRARRGNYAYFLPDTIGQYVSLQQPCDLMTIGSFLMDEHFAFAVHKGAGLLEQLNNVIAMLEYDGFLEQLYFKYWDKNSQCSQSSKMYSLSSAQSHHQPFSLLLFICVVMVTR